MFRNPINPFILQILIRISHFMSKYDWIEKSLYYNSSICQFFGRKCAACAKCVEVCHQEALMKGESIIEIDPEKCNQCGDCVSICPSGALGQKLEDWHPISERIQGHEGQVLVLCEASSWREVIEPQISSEKRLPAGVEAILIDRIGVLSEVDFAQALLTSRKAVVVLVLGENDTERPFAQAARLVGEIATYLAGQNGHEDTPLISLIPDVETFWSRIVEITESPGYQLLPQYSIPEDEEKRQGFRNILNAWLNLHDHLAPIAVVIPHPCYASITCEREKCTLCGACANHCKVNALRILRQENTLFHTPIACLNCGACVEICPEQALTLESGLRLDPLFFSEQMLAKGEGLRCSECGKIFTSLKRSQRASQKLQEVRGADPIREELLKLCPECRAKKAFFTYDEWTSKQ
jgi:ferredoxin